MSALMAIAVSRYRPVNLELEMTQNDFESALLRLGAIDISEGMSVGTFDGFEPEKNAPVRWGGIWKLSRQNLTIEASFENQRLKNLNLWDWTGRRLNSYHHVLEYDRVSSLTISLLQTRHSAERIETLNLGVNPPVRTDGQNGG